MTKSRKPGRRAKPARAVARARAGAKARKGKLPGAAAAPSARAALARGKAKKPAARSGKALSVSPLAPKSLPALPPLAGVRLGTAQAGIKYAGRTDLLAVTLAPGTQVAGVFTTSKMPSAAVDWCRAALAQGGTGRVLIVNSGNANAFTGARGAESARAVAAAAAAAAGCKPSDVLLASTGVIGEPLPHERILKALPQAMASSAAGAWADAARAIMTTDTFPKTATATAEIDGHTVTINGIAKGSGMIAPDLATMLAFVFTDAAIAAPVLQTLLMLGVRDSFNCTTVDGDTSTSDTVLLFATGKGAAHTPVTRPGDRRLADFKAKLDRVLLELALLVVRDGEGAQKLVTIDVTGAESPKAARTIAMAIANSPLVKTAIAGGDANWGRIVMAVGKSGERADRDRLSIRFGGRRVAANGMRDPAYDEAAAGAYMKRDNIEIAVDLGIGKGAARVYTCDLTHGYISINADYRS